MSHPVTDLDLTGLDLRFDGGVLTVTIDHGPINLLDVPLFVSLLQLTEALMDPGDVRVVVLESANPDFFIAHFDVEAILALPTGQDSTDLSAFHQMVERWRTMPCATIAKVAGIVRGGGCETISSFDMRFAANESAVFGQPEVALGILPGGSGTQRLPHLVGRGRALEMILGCDDIDAATAERWGLVNRALPAAELDAFVDRLARRIASFPAAAIAEAKASTLRAEADPTPGLLAEAAAFDRLVGRDDARALMQSFLDRGGQTAAVERDLQSLFDS